MHKSLSFCPIAVFLKTVLFFAVCIGTAYSQHYRVVTMSANDGMPSSTVLRVDQASDGTMWYLLRTGVASYDGRNWRVFGTSDGLPAVSMSDMVIDHKDRVWVTTHLSANILSYYDGRRWNIVQPPVGYRHQGAGYHHIAVADGDGEVRIGIASRLGALIYTNGVWIRFVDENGLPSNNIRSIKASKDGLGFLISTDQGIARIGDYGVQPIAGLPDRFRDVYAAIPGREGTFAEEGFVIYAANHLGFLNKNGRWQEFATIPDDYYTRRPFESALLQDRNGDLWFGDRFGAFHYRVKQENLTRLFKQHGLIGEGMNDIFEDREHQILVASNRGVSVFSRMLFRNYNSNVGLLEDEVSSVFEWRPGVYVFGHNQGLTVFDGQNYSVVRFPNKDSGDNSRRTMEICHDGEGGLWIAATALGIVHLSKDMTVRYDPLLLEDGKKAWAFSVKRLPSGETLVASSFGLWTLRNNRFVPYLPGLASNLRLRRILVTDDGTIVLATFGDGILVRRNGAWEHLRDSNAWRNNAFDLIQLRDGRILIGSEAGVLELQKEKIVPFRSSGFFLKRPTFFMLEDDAGRLWFGTDAGLYRHDGKGMRQYGMNDGFSGLECNRDGAIKDHRGDLWFGTVGGVSLLQEAFDIPKVPPTLKLHGGTAGVSRFGPNESLQVGPEDNTLSFYFNAISMVETRTTYYSAWLDGLERSWGPEQIVSDAPIIYNNLKPGAYRLKLRVRNDLGIWTKPMESGVIVVEEPFWYAWWVWMIAVLLLCGLIYTVSDYRSSKRHGEFLKNQVRESTWELTRKNQMLEERIEAHARAKREVQALNEDLEVRVLERTAALEAAQKDLVESAHYEGMAEIATSMLHNVGNILNSVSTSGFLIKEQLEKSKVESLHLASEMLAPRLDDFEIFLQEDPKARNLLRFYLNLEEKLEKERHRMMEQVTLLLEKVDTIKDVVSQQHNYTSGVYQTEIKPPIQLVDTALKIMEASLQSKGIEVVRDLHMTPPIALQKTKMIHTLVNLLKNAGEAVAEGGIEKIIRVGVYQVDDSVRIVIEDTGCGIEKESLEKIFNHGFTTKAEGHGFGLHSCANAVHEMGGTMWAESAGIGRGSTFILSFPIPGS